MPCAWASLCHPRLLTTHKFTACHRLDSFIKAGTVWEVYLRSYMTLTSPEDEDHRPMLKRLRMFATQL